jgi:DNA-binding IclR family transcriptional regulator
VLDGAAVTFVDQVIAPHRLRAVSAVGESFPLHTCAPGKAMLAAMPPERLTTVLPASLPAFTARTTTSVAALCEELRQDRETGVAYDREEHTAGICAVGALVGGTAERPLAIGVPMPAQRFYGRESELRAALLACCARAQCEADPAC